MWTWPGKKTLFMGSEFGQYNEWYYATSLDWHLLAHSDHRGIQRWIRDLNYFYRRFSWLGYYDDEPCGFQWIDADDANHSVFTYLRCGKDPKERILVACNFTFIARNHYRVGIPLDGIWEEILNSDAREYGGHGFGNWGKVYSKPIHFHGMPHSIDIFLPSNSVLIFQWKSGK
jgi:1,4-alpha-glucan branching enzyme